MQYITFNNGVKIPQAGLGTYLLKPDDAQASVTFALENGYKLIDTANAYVNERAVGRGMRESGREREEIFLETKLWPCFYESDTAVDETLERLGTKYIDLMILHQLIQVECHPYYPQTKLRELLAKHGIALQAWYPLGGRDNKSILEEPVVTELAEKHGKTAAQIVMRWHIQQGNIVIPGSKTPSHIIDNIGIFGFELADDDMAAIATLDQGSPIYVRTPEKMELYATWRPDVEGQK